MALGGVAVVTGASCGIGREIALALARRGEGEKIALVARSQSRLEEVANQIRGLGNGIVTMVVPGDVRIEGDVKSNFKRISDELGRINWTYLAAGLNYFLQDDEMSPEQKEEIGKVNRGGAIYCAEAFVDNRSREGRTGIVLISSMAVRVFERLGIYPWGHQAYTEAKLAAEKHITQLGKQLSIPVRIVRAGPVKTGFARKSSGEYQYPQREMREAISPESVADFAISRWYGWGWGVAKTSHIPWIHNAGLTGLSLVCPGYLKNLIDRRSRPDNYLEVQRGKRRG